ncbi:unknown [Bacteroides sp. CAG:545]|nr:unknown [Bacteroides sp. CAG:545]
MAIDREEFLLVRISDSGAYVVREIRFQVRVTKRNVQRIGIVRNRHELCRSRLRRTSEIETAYVRVVIHIVPEHGGWGPVHDSIVITLAVSLIVRNRRNYRSSDLGPEFVLLVHEVETCTVSLVLVQHIIGILGVPGLAHDDVLSAAVLSCSRAEVRVVCDTEFRTRISRIVSVLRGLVLAPSILVIRLKIEPGTQRLRIDKPAAYRRRLGILVVALIDYFIDIIRAVTCGSEGFCQ